ncbi:MAG: FimV-like protein [Gammaproteobacteria bacterium]
MGLMLLLVAPLVEAQSAVASQSFAGLQLAQSETSASSSGAVSQASQYGPVLRDESLWQISQRFRPRGITMAQTMMAIYKANPDAFLDNNINRLKVGSVLTIPAFQPASLTDSRAAYKEASTHIDRYEKEVRQVRVERGELKPLSAAPREPDLLPAITPTEMAEISQVKLSQITEIKAELKKEEEQLVEVAPPLPKAKKKAPRKPERPLFRYSYDLAAINDSNVRLAQNDVDIRDDAIFSVTLNARGGRPLDSFSIWNYGASATYNSFSTFDGLNNIDFNINTRYRFALSSGFTSPIYSLGIKIGGVEYDTEMRDATVLSLSADLNKWVTNTINMTAGWVFKTQDSKSEAYDTSENRLFVNFDTNLSKTDLIYTTLTYITGDVVSSASPTLAIINAAEAIEPDDVFGGITTNQFAYRLDAETIVITLGYNKILTQSLSMDVSARIVDTTSSVDSDIGYERTLLRASLLGRF